MTTVDHELTFCSDAAGWINAELDQRPELAFQHVTIDQSTKGSRKRRDLTITDRTGKIAIAGEVKLPYQPGGGSPYDEGVVSDAHSKAARVGARYFLTWNVNRIVLWQTDDADKPLFERRVYEEAFVQVRDADDLVAPGVQQAIRRGLLRFLERADQAYSGTLPLAKRPLDEFFITVLEAALERPIALTQRAIAGRYQSDGRFKTKLDAWMRDAQQWHLSDDELVQRDNLERAAKFACYVLVNRIVFFQALRKRFKLPKLRISTDLSEPTALEALFAQFFARAKKVTRDYETVFDGDFGDELPFVSQHSVPAWRDLLKSIDRFDFTQINYDVIGPIFERLISPEERHRYGQHYTKPEIVDLINAFCIRRADAAVLDPACGGGTFLVRAYNRKRFLGNRDGLYVAHEELLDQLCGVDISAYAAHLTTMNLATRDLIDEHNYPLVAQSDFFDVRPGREVYRIPALAADGGAKLFRPVKIDQVDAVIGNPPYVRQEEISKPPTTSAKGKVRVAARTLEQIKAEAARYKQHLQELAQAACPAVHLSGRSDLHVYFWPHAKTFLKDDAWFGFLTSSSWLDVEYGFRLQDFVLRNYRIVAIFESQVEPWFTGARVTTCATILQREPDLGKREDNRVRFVQLRSPLAEIFPSSASEEQRQQAAEALRDRIESLRENVTERHWRVRVVRQVDLYRLGCRTADPALHDEDESDGEAAATGRLSATIPGYYGAKWSVYLRAPDLFFKLRERYGDRLVPLAELADVKRGITTGCDKFFFVRDITGECLERVPDPKEFRKTYGVQPVQTGHIRIVKAGDGSLHLIEADYLEPEVHSLMELSRASIDDSVLSRRVLLCDKPKRRLQRTKVLRYIEWGEREGFHNAVTVAARATSRPWYDVTDCVRPQIVLPKIQQYRHIVPINPRRRTCNCALMGVTTTLPPGLLAAVLNSTFVGFMKWFYARQLGNEGNLQLDVYAAKQMPVPDPRRAKKNIADRLRAVFDRFQNRDVPDLDEDLDAADRRELDDAVIELLGEESRAKRELLISELYAEIRTMHRHMKDKERVAVRNRAATARGSTLSTEQIAQEIWASLGSSLVRRFPEDFFDPGEPAEVVDLHGTKCRVVDNSLLSHAGIDIDGNYTELGNAARARLVKTIFDSGRRGSTPIPLDPGLCQSVDRRYRQYREQAESEFAVQAAQKTANEKLQAKVIANLCHRLANGSA